jgi:hypothetical protein
VIHAPLIRRANQGRALGLGYAAFSAVYLASGTFQVGTPVALTPSALDAAMPFASWTIWIYLSQLLLLPAAILSARDDGARSQTFYAMLVATAGASAVFTLWPTQLERPAVPSSGLTGLAWSALYFADTPNNCMPSLHVALAAIAGGGLWRAGWRATALVWVSAVALSTLTTKQHIVWDACAGLALAAAAWRLTPSLIRHERTHAAADRASA